MTMQAKEPDKLQKLFASMFHLALDMLIEILVEDMCPRKYFEWPIRKEDDPKRPEWCNAYCTEDAWNCKAGYENPAPIRRQCWIDYFMDKATTDKALENVREFLRGDHSNYNCKGGG